MTHLIFVGGGWDSLRSDPFHICGESWDSLRGDPFDMCGEVEIA